MNQLLEIAEELLVFGRVAAHPLVDADGKPTEDAEGVALDHATGVTTTGRLDDRVVRVPRIDFQRLDIHRAVLDPSAIRGAAERHRSAAAADCSSGWFGTFYFAGCPSAFHFTLA